MSTVPATTNSKLNEEKRKEIFKIPKFLKYIRKRSSASNTPEALNPITTEISNPPEAVESLRKYETEQEQAQKFLDRVGQNFRWPASMEDCVRATVFFYLADESALKFDDETAFNLIFFFDNLDKGTFDEYKDSWVKELEDLEQEMPGAVYLPVDKSHLDNLMKSQPAKTVSVQRVNREHM
ncbi:20923_t:CDS:2, partial [Racocetra persica]